MREIVVRAFFEGRASPAELTRELEAARIGSDAPGCRTSANYLVAAMARSFEVTAAHLTRLVCAALDGDVSLSALGTLMFCMQTGDRWTWDADTDDGARVADAMFWLGAPEVNFPLTPAVLRKIRLYLLTGENTLSGADAAPGLDRPASS